MQIEPSESRHKYRAGTANILNGWYGVHDEQTIANDHTLRTDTSGHPCGRKRDAPDALYNGIAEAINAGRRISDSGYSSEATVCARFSKSDSRGRASRGTYPSLF